MLIDSHCHLDPGYFKDFWTHPGYMGADRPESFAADLLAAAMRHESLDDDVGSRR